MRMEESSKSKSWINIAKICSMGGVVLQHVRGYVYSDDYIFYSVWWSVALFVMIGGYNAYSSYQNRGCFQLKTKLLGIFIPYFFATVIYVAYNNHYLDAITLLQNLLHFNATGPLYYVAVYIQLLVVSPVLIGIIEKCKNHKWLFIISWIVVIGIGALTTHYTNLFDIVIGGGNLFAGPWIVFWFLGMCIKYLEQNVAVKQEMEKWIVIGLTASIVVWQYVFVNKRLNLELGSLYHGTQVGMTWANAFETVLLFFWFKYVVELCERYKGNVVATIINVFDFMGRYTLYIFLYHMLFISLYRAYLEIPIYEVNRWACLFFIMVGSIILGLIFKRLRMYFINLLKEVRVV